MRSFMHPKSTICCFRCQPRVLKLRDLEQFSHCNQNHFPENRSVEIVQAQLQTGNRNQVDLTFKKWRLENSIRSIYLEHLKWCILVVNSELSHKALMYTAGVIHIIIHIIIYIYNRSYNCLCWHNFAWDITTVLTPVMIFRGSLLHSFMGAAVANLCAVPRISALLTWRQILSTATTPDQIWCRHAKDVWSNFKEHHILGALGSLPSAAKPKHQNVNVFHCKKTTSVWEAAASHAAFHFGYVHSSDCHKSYRPRKKVVCVCRDLHGRKTHLSTNCCVGTFRAEHTQEQWNQPESWHQTAV